MKLITTSVIVCLVLINPVISYGGMRNSRLGLDSRGRPMKLELSPTFGKGSHIKEGFVTKYPPHMTHESQVAAQKLGNDRYKVFYETTMPKKYNFNTTIQLQYRGN